MIQIRPISDLRNKFTEIEAIVNDGNPVYLKKNGYWSMVVLSIEDYSNLINCIESKLDEADREATNSSERLNHDEVFKGVRRFISGR